MEGWSPARNDLLHGRPARLSRAWVLEAIGLYRRLGFKTIEPYYELPEALRNWLVFMELVL
jgi:hypothetical protein